MMMSDKLTIGSQRIVETVYIKEPNKLRMKFKSILSNFSKADAWKSQIRSFMAMSSFW